MEMGINRNIDRVQQYAAPGKTAYDVVVPPLVAAQLLTGT